MSTFQQRNFHYAKKQKDLKWSKKKKKKKSEFQH